MAAVSQLLRLAFAEHSAAAAQGLPVGTALEVCASPAAAAALDSCSGPGYLRDTATAGCTAG